MIDALGAREATRAVTSGCRGRRQRRGGPVHKLWHGRRAWLCAEFALAQESQIGGPCSARHQSCRPRPAAGARRVAGAGRAVRLGYVVAPRLGSARGGRAPWRSSGSVSRCGGSRISGSSPASGATPTTSTSRARSTAASLRSPEAHARIGAIDAEAAKAAPGVLAVITGADLEAAGRQRPALRDPDGEPRRLEGRQHAAPGPVHRAGAPRRRRVAFVVAETLAQAKDAAELVMVDYDSPAGGRPRPRPRARAGQPLVHDDVPGNLAFDWEYGDRARGRGGARQGGARGRAADRQQPPGRERDRAARRRSPSWTRRAGSRCTPARRAAGCWTRHPIAGAAQVASRPDPDPDARRRRRLRHEGVPLPGVRDGGVRRARSSAARSSGPASAARPSSPTSWAATT